MSLQELKQVQKYGNKILELIDDQLSAYTNTDGMDRSITRSDLQGVIDALVHRIIRETKETSNPDEMNITWCVDDVKSLDEELSDEECRKVLALAKSEHDATIGVNWDVLEHWIGVVREEREGGK